MFYHDGKLQYKVEIEKPNPTFAKMLQQAIGGVEGEIRVSMQYMFQAWNSRGPKRYRDMLLDTATEELAHIEMLSTAVAMNLEGASSEVKTALSAKNPFVASIMGGMNPPSYLSGGFGAMPVDSAGNPFNGSWVVSSGNIAADMYANVTAEATGRALAARLYNMTDDKGMKDMLSFLLARDTMHQNQWLAVIEELGGPEAALPIPNSLPREAENQDFNYSFVTTRIGDDAEPPKGRWTEGQSIDGKGTFNVKTAAPLAPEPHLGLSPTDGFAQTEQSVKP